ncbi:hypothetical protein K7X08_016059 [Anisodus acutangulus]|uniref:Uncharacterized protein n=1 Tax=Anisodus acutangulus TaxID=402998 RepID=A0A9Q1LFA9_9SOLA|nr:hypothetical protein K7X08_016059 [Anisodus acutangulus]
MSFYLSSMLCNTALPDPLVLGMLGVRTSHKIQGYRFEPLNLLTELHSRLKAHACDRSQFCQWCLSEIAASHLTAILLHWV